MQRKPWTQTEDFALKALVQQYGLSNWTLVALRLSQRCSGSQRAGKQCRERWLNHLDLKVSKKPWTKNEENIIFQLHQQFGNKWREIANHLQARTENDIKNHFYATLRKGFRRLNKIIGFKLDPSKIRKIKPNILSKISQAYCNPQNIKIEHQLNFRVFNLILELSKKEATQIEYEEVIEDEELMKESQKFLQRVLQQNQQYENMRMKKKEQSKSRQVSLRQAKSQIPDSEIDISQYLCLRIEQEEIEQIRSRSEESRRKSEMLNKESKNQHSV